MPHYLEENRFLYVESSLGPNALLLESFTGTEGISQLYSFQLELLSENPRIKFEDVLGQEMSFGVAGTDESEQRHIHGIVTAFTQLPGTQRLARYRATVSPRLWIYTLRQNVRIFQQLSVPDILKKVLASLDVVWELHGTHLPREYCVQYRETDFNFVARLMEEEGIFYFFRFTRGAHKLVVADTPVSHQDIPGDSSIVYEEVAGGLRDEVRVSSWAKTQELGPGKHSLRDYCYGTPAADMTVNQQVLDSVQVGKVTHKLKVGGNEQFEVYDYPGGYGTRAQAGGSGAKSAGSSIAKLGMERMEVAQFLIRGESNAFNLTPGYRFALTRHASADGAYVLTSVAHSASEGGFHSAAELGTNHYSNIFECIPVALPYRPPQSAAKPRVWGCQTAVVVGPAGEEIYTDKYGRIKVQFHWDREGKKDASSSCWVRVATFWAGGSWGVVHIPRIGQEVIMDFLEGDPDCPIVVGSVYNGNNMPPYELPANKTQSGLISRSSQNGSGANYNQIRFEDKKGSEEVLIHAEKNLNTEVENDESRSVGHDRATTIGNNCTTKIGKDRTIKIGHDETIEIANNRSTNIGSHDNTTIGGQMTLSVGSNRTAQVGGNDSETVATNQSVTVGGNQDVIVGGSKSLTAVSISITGSNVTITAGQITLNAPIVTVTGVVQCTNVIASIGVVSPTYTPGAGNIW